MSWTKRGFYAGGKYHSLPLVDKLAKISENLGLSNELPGKLVVLPDANFLLNAKNVITFPFLQDDDLI